MLKLVLPHIPNKTNQFSKILAMKRLICQYWKSPAKSHTEIRKIHNFSGSKTSLFPIAQGNL